MYCTKTNDKPGNIFAIHIIDHELISLLCKVFREDGKEALNIKQKWVDGELGLGGNVVRTAALLEGTKDWSPHSLLF